MRSLRKLFKKLRVNRSGTSATEFALALPLLLTVGLYGAETANLTLVHMKVSQLAMQIADNAARIGDTSTISDRKVFEGDVNDLLVGAKLQGGPSLNFYKKGRAIISSVEVFDDAISCKSGSCPSPKPADGAIFIHWQRCKGKKAVVSSYGEQDDVLPSGIGPAGLEVAPELGHAVLFVELQYDYQPLISSRFFGPTTIKAISTFVSRDNIDLSGLKQRKPANPDPPSRCILFTEP